MAQSTKTPATHTVKQGEHIASIADVFVRGGEGFLSQPWMVATATWW